MQVSPAQAFAAINQARQKGNNVTNLQPNLLFAGATGALGAAVLRRLVGVQLFAHTRVLAREPMQQGMRQISLHQVSGDVAQWPSAPRSDVAIVMFEPPRMFYERERALWTPLPEQLPELAAWLHAGGANTLAIVLPHAQGSLPESLKRGMASLDEQAVASIGFERLLILRSAEKPVDLKHSNALEKLAHWMLSIFKFMVPTHEQPVRATKIAEILDALLQAAPHGTHVIAPQEMWAMSQLSFEDVMRAVQARFDKASKIN